MASTRCVHVVDFERERAQRNWIARRFAIHTAAVVEFVGVAVAETLESRVAHQTCKVLEVGFEAADLEDEAFEVDVLEIEIMQTKRVIDGEY